MNPAVREASAIPARGAIAVVAGARAAIFASGPLTEERLAAACTSGILWLTNETVSAFLPSRMISIE